MRMKRIRSDLQRLLCMDQAVSAKNAANLSGLTDLQAQIRARARTFREAFEKLNKVVPQKTNDVSACNAKLAQLERTIRDFWMALKRRNKRLGLPPPTSLYPRNEGRVGRIQDWILIAQDLIQGEELARLAGQPPLHTIKEVEIRLEEARTLSEQVNESMWTFRQAQANLAKERAEVDVLITDLAAELRHTLRHLPGATRRRIMRRYGFRFEEASSKSR